MSIRPYVPNGIPLTAHEREILVILMEECAEVIAAASKLVRFGKENRPDSGESNIDVLCAEIGDMLCMIEMTEALNLARGEEINRGIIRKHERLARFLQTEPS